MPIEATPLEQVVVPVAAKCTGEPTVLLLVGEVTDTPELVLTVMVMAVVDAAPQ